MKPSDLYMVAEAVRPILAQARIYRKAARLARDATPQFGPDPAGGTFELPDSFGIKAEYRMMRGRMLVPVLATGLWAAPGEA